VHDLTGGPQIPHQSRWGSGWVAVRCIASLTMEPSPRSWTGVLGDHKCAGDPQRRLTQHSSALNVHAGPGELLRSPALPLVVVVGTALGQSQALQFGPVMALAVGVLVGYFSGMLQLPFETGPKPSSGRLKSHPRADGVLDGRLCGALLCGDTICHRFY
jgi:hypothetical protein